MAMLNMSFLSIHLLLLAASFAFAMEDTMPSSRTSLDDASEVTWAHAVNSRGQLEDALSSDVEFLEADISMGHLVGKESGPSMPIMAHPPDVTSDISLEQWLDLVISRATGKGVKLDFKFIEAVEPTLTILKSHERKVNFRLWLNADILPGPVNSTQTPVSAHEFIDICHKHFPNATLSVGWTTYWFETFPLETWQYGWNHVRAMADVLSCSGLKPGEDHPLTFPVRAVYACRSIPQLHWLLDMFPSSTLTVWSGSQDSVEVDDLLKIRKAFKLSEVYYDVPKQLRSSFDLKKSLEESPTYAPQSRTFQWETVKDTSSNSSCKAKTFIGSKSLVFGQNSTMALISKSSFLADELLPLNIQGKVVFFSSKDDGSLVPSPGIHQLVLVLADNSEPPSQGGSEEAMDAIWKDRNVYHLHKFQHDFTSSPRSCHFFRLDTSEDRTFEAWTAPCDMPEDEIVQKGVAEIPRTKRLVMPRGPVRFGLLSYGNGHVAVQDLEVNGTKAVSMTDGSTATAPSALHLGVLLVSALVVML